MRSRYEDDMWPRLSVAGGVLGVSGHFLLPGAGFRDSNLPLGKVRSERLRLPSVDDDLRNLAVIRGRPTYYQLALGPAHMRYHRRRWQVIDRRERPGEIGL